MLIAREKARQKRNAARRARYAAKRDIKKTMVRISFSSKPGATRKAARARRAALAVTVAASAADAPAQVAVADAFNYRAIAPKDRARSRRAVTISSKASEVALEDSAVNAFKLVDELLTERVGESWWAESTKAKEGKKKKVSGVHSTERMGTIGPSGIMRIVAISDGLPVVDVGFGYGQVVWQLLMIGANVIGGMEMEPDYVDIALSMHAQFFKALEAHRGVACIFACEPMSSSWIHHSPRCYYINNLALSFAKNEALWEIFKAAPVGSKVIATSVLTSKRQCEDGGRWRMHYDPFPFTAHHSVSAGKTYAHGLVCYTRVL